MGDDSPSIVFVVKNPSKGDDSFKLTVSLESTLADVQRMIHESYDGKPAPSTQTLIYAGKVLKDVNAKVKDILKEPIDPNTPQSLHLVVRTRSMVTGLPSARPAANQISDTAPLPATGSSSAAGAAAEPNNAAGPSNAPWPQQYAPQFAGHSVQFGAMPASPFGMPGAQATAADAVSPAAAGGDWPTGAAAPAATAGAANAAMASAAMAAAAAAASAPFAAGVQMGGMSSPFLTMPLLQQQQQQPVLLVNPMVAAAYQAAYAAALTAAQNVQQQMQGNADGASSSTAPPPPSLVPFVPPFAPAFALCYSTPYNQANQGVEAGVAGPYGVLPQPQFGGPGQFAWNAYAGMDAGAGAGAPTSAGRLPHQAAAGVRRRFVFANRGQGAQAEHGQAPQAAHHHAHHHIPQQPQQQPGAAVAAQRRGHVRTITFRISARTLLQALVFAIVLWQHCTWQRLAMLLVGAAVLYVTSSWAPFRQFITSLAVPAPPRAGAPGAAGIAAPAPPPAGGPQQQGGAQPPPAQHMAAGGAALDAGAAAAGAAQAARLANGAPNAAAAAGAVAAGPGLPGQRMGVMWEILTLVVGFLTSLLPAWNFNQEDAAVFAAAQELLAREEQQERQRQQGRAQAAGVGDEGRME